MTTVKSRRQLLQYIEQQFKQRFPKANVQALFMRDDESISVITTELMHNPQLWQADASDDDEFCFRRYTGKPAIVLFPIPTMEF